MRPLRSLLMRHYINHHEHLATLTLSITIMASIDLYSSFQYVTLVAGQLIALGVQSILQQILSEPDLKSWDWHILFASKQFSKMDSKSCESAGMIRTLLKHPKVGLTLGRTVAFYTYTPLFAEIHSEH